MLAAPTFIAGARGPRDLRVLQNAFT